MSRAIDNGAKELLKRGNHQDVFDTIAQLLSQRLPKLLEIEFLAGESSYAIVDRDKTIFLQDDACIAIPKFRLLQAFIVARQILLRYLRATSEGKVEKDDTDAVMKAAGVMLLMDPEHLTAANSRKRLLLKGLQDGENTHQILRDEKYFIDSLLTSRLHRHTKSPTLWNHRQWLTERFLEHGLDLDAAETMKSVILVAAERHPRNYYAWSHARYLVDKTPLRADSNANANVSDEILRAAKQWTLSHHDDISGWAFLMFFLGRYPKHAEAVVAETMELAGSLGWRNESVWYFLRNMVRLQKQQEKQQPDVMQDPDVKFRSTRLALLRGAGEEERRVLDRALGWIELEAVD